MASTGIEAHARTDVQKDDALADTVPLGAGVDEKQAPAPYYEDDGVGLKTGYDHTHRKLKPRHIQLIGIGG
jgi:amino acid permease